MTAVQELEHRFVEVVPSKLEAGILYVSLEYTTMMHLCCCGCGNEVVTPLSPNDWRMTFDGRTVSVHPSIGSWSLPCRSHYVIKHGSVNWADDWTDEQIARGRTRDHARKFDELKKPLAAPQAILQRNQLAKTSFWKKIKQWIFT